MPTRNPILHTPADSLVKILSSQDEGVIEGEKGEKRDIARKLEREREREREKGEERRERSAKN
jgi:hypothetical protein